MKDTRVAKRYAAALFGVAQRDGILEAVAQDVTLIERFVGEVPYLRAVLLQPLVIEDRKFKVVGRCLRRPGDSIFAELCQAAYPQAARRPDQRVHRRVPAPGRTGAEPCRRRATTAVPLTELQTQQMAVAWKR